MAQLDVGDVKQKLQSLQVLITQIRHGTAQPGDMTQALQLVRELHTHVNGEDTKRLVCYN